MENHSHITNPRWVHYHLALPPSLRPLQIIRRLIIINGEMGLSNYLQIVWKVFYTKGTTLKKQNLISSLTAQRIINSLTQIVDSFFLLYQPFLSYTFNK